MRHLKYLLFLGVLWGCSDEKDPEPILFTSLDPSETGLHFSNDLVDTKALNILDYLYYYNGGGVAIGDINADKLPDIFLTSNQGDNKLYLNQGNLKFKDITEKAGVAGSSDWNTGATMADINADGLLDLYVTSVVGINGLRGRNELYINQGDGTFTEEAASYGLDFQNYSSNASFFDYDNDGDLDMYLLNHAVHTVNAYGPAEIRNTRHKQSGDKLLRNDGDTFVDVSEEAGIYGGANSYGLGVATADFNNDGFTDIYVSNDFHEDDYYYINNGDGTFTEDLKNRFGHVSRFSMGSDVADINGDGFMDLLTLDMLPEDEKVLKASMGDDPLDLHNMKIERLNYHHQYTRNMLQINRGGSYFQEVGLLSGLAATDWSWAALFGDYNLDGQQDVFIATGIPKRPNDLDYIKYVSNEQIQKKMSTTRLVDQKALDLMPSGAVQNYIFEGAEDLGFIDRSGQWISKDSVISTGAAYADLDLDGDLDIVTNNVNQKASIYRNNVDTLNNFLKVSLQLPGKNTKGIGSKILLYNNGSLQIRQLFTSRGFQSSSEPSVLFGLGDAQEVDSLVVIWPDNSFQVEKNIDANQLLELEPKKGRQMYSYPTSHKRNLFTKVDSLPGLDFRHEENDYKDFNRQKLIPYQISDQGPAVAVEDLNGDGLQDLFFGHSKFSPAEVYFQRDGALVKQDLPALAGDSITEDVSVAVHDFSRDGIKDLFVVSSGGEFTGENVALLDRLYLGTGQGKFSKSPIPVPYSNGAVVKASDFDKDGDPDIFVGGRAVSSDFGKIPQSYLLINTEKGFKRNTPEGLERPGMITDAAWVDFNEDGWEDLVLVGEWTAPLFFKNNKGKLEQVSDLFSQPLKGLWQSLETGDFNQDGKVDFLLGNWGLNTKFSASAKYPLKMYYLDFDKNGSTETIVAYEKDGSYYPAAHLDELAGQLSYLKKKYPSYREFAGQTIEQIFDEDVLSKAEVLTVDTMASGYLLSGNNHYTFRAFPSSLQVAPITSFLTADFDQDDKKEILVAGNYFGTTPYHGRFDALAGNLIDEDGEIFEGHEIGLNLTQKAVRGLDIINIRGKSFLLVTINNAKPEIYLINE